jgi:hypothetical protein
VNQLLEAVLTMLKSPLLLVLDVMVTSPYKSALPQYNNDAPFVPPG